MAMNRFFVVVAATALAFSYSIGPTPALAGKPGDKGKPAPTTARTIEFSGRQWQVKQFEDRRVGPGPNYFSDDAENLWVDAQGRLHLAITYRDNRWYAAEVISNETFGYGTYRWYLDSRVDALASNVVVGLFTWHDRSRYNHREIDIEFARWNDAQHPGGQYVVQPWDTPGNLTTFAMPTALAQSTHQFVWSRSDVFFESLVGHRASPSGPSDVIAQFLYAGADVPRTGGENARMNLWLFQGGPPSDGQPVELVISGFEFVPG
jgi:hypothetical protein